MGRIWTLRIGFGEQVPGRDPCTTTDTGMGNVLGQAWAQDSERCSQVPELNEPARPAAARPVSHDAAGPLRRRAGARCGQTEEDNVGGNRRIAAVSMPWTVTDL
jgi:hypothetical protein